MLKVLVVCHGNICRSPLAAALLSRQFSVRQGGFSAEGRKSPPKIRRAAERLKLSLESHRSRKVTTHDARWADVILYMDSGNRARVWMAFKKYFGKAKCLGTYGQRTRIPDPNFLKEDTDDFSACMSLIEKSCKQFIETHKGD